jgi:hypothetical protein
MPLSSSVFGPEALVVLLRAYRFAASLIAMADENDSG